MRIMLAAVLGLPLAVSAGARAADSDWAAVATALGRSGAEMPGGVYRVGMPRTDLHVTLDGVALKPGFALGSWLAFRRVGNDAMVMGDLVLTETEIAPVMTKLAEGGIEVTALHNHLLRAQPATFYMHVLGHGDPARLAAALHDGLAQSKTPLGASAAAPPASAAPRSQVPPAVAADTTGGANTGTAEIDMAMLDRTLGAKGRDAGGVYQFTIPRAETVRDGGMDVPVAMGTGEAINFQATGVGRVAITGDFVLTAAEVNPVLRALRRNGIEVTALHNHMLADEPRLFFMHFWANDEAQKLAKGLRDALDQVHVQRS
jgi:hypothetical protein